MSYLLSAIPFFVGAILGLGMVVYWYVWKVKNARRRFWSRGKGQLLRPPGYSISLKLAEHSEKMDRPLFALFLGGGIVGAVTWAFAHATWKVYTSDPIRQQLNAEGWQVITSADKFWPALVSLILLFVGGVGAVIWARIRFIEWMREQYRLRTGLRGEQAAADELQPAVRAGYYLFNDVPTDADCNIDHVLVGPAGVFALETKARSKPENLNGRDLVAEFDGQRISFTGGAYEAKGPRQAKAGAKWLAQEISRATGRSIGVRAVVVLPGWFVPRNNFEHVIARNPEYLAKEIRNSRRAINDEDVEAVAQHLEKLCRDVAI